MLQTGDYGGQCVTYVSNYFDRNVGVDYAYQVATSSNFTKASGPTAGVIACWSGGPIDTEHGMTVGYGHVGVVGVWDTAAKTMTFSDSNRKNDETVIVNKGITEATMKGYFGSRYKFEGYYKFK